MVSLVHKMNLRKGSPSPSCYLFLEQGPWIQSCMAPGQNMSFLWGLKMPVEPKPILHNSDWHFPGIEKESPSLRTPKYQKNKRGLILVLYCDLMVYWSLMLYLFTFSQVSQGESHDPLLLVAPTILMTWLHQYHDNCQEILSHIK